MVTLELDHRHFLPRATTCHCLSDQTVGHEHHAHQRLKLSLRLIFTFAYPLAESEQVRPYADGGVPARQCPISCR